MRRRQIIWPPPRSRAATLGADLDLGRRPLFGDLARYVRHTAAPPGPSQVFGSEVLLDIATPHDLTDRLRRHSGVINATDEYADRVVGSNDGRPYTEVGELGVDGRECFVRNSTRG